MRFCSLGSGSSGNATLLEARSGTTTTRLLIDCGLPYKHLEERLARRGLGLEDLDAVFVTHEHSDHIGCARQLALQVRVPIWMSRGTYAAIGAPDMGGYVRFVSDGVGVAIGDCHLRPFTVAHDAKEPLQLVVSDGQKTVGLLTDVGHTTPYVSSCMQGLDALILECNHDADLLTAGAYPPFLKQRVAGNYGHLSNEQAAQFLQTVSHHGLQHVVAAHLSLQNNKTDLAQAALAQVLNANPSDICVADAENGFDWLAV
ncbi:MAG: MBL fold metallo-hydrolase [Cytophagales bacterium]|nr:MBL fold metallo-hydrolase [Cytophagales bacterium]